MQRFAVPITVCAILLAACSPTMGDKLRETSESLDTAIADLADLRAEHADLVSDGEQLSSTLGRHERDLDALTDQLDKAADLLDERTSELARATQELEDVQDDVASLADELNQMEDKVDVLSAAMATPTPVPVSSTTARTAARTAPEPTSEPAPAPSENSSNAAPPPAPAQTSNDSVGANCTEERAHGHSGMDRSHPHYREKFDGDDDGIACE